MSPVRSALRVSVLFFLLLPVGATNAATLVLEIRAENAVGDHVVAPGQHVGVVVGPPSSIHVPVALLELAPLGLEALADALERYGLKAISPLSGAIDGGVAQLTIAVTAIAREDDDTTFDVVISGVELSNGLLRLRALGYRRDLGIRVEHDLVLFDGVAWLE